MTSLDPDLIKMLRLKSFEQYANNGGKLKEYSRFINVYIESSDEKQKLFDEYVEKSGSHFVDCAIKYMKLYDEL